MPRSTPPAHRLSSWPRRTPRRRHPAATARRRTTTVRFLVNPGDPGQVLDPQIPPSEPVRRRDQAEPAQRVGDIGRLDRTGTHIRRQLGRQHIVGGRIEAEVEKPGDQHRVFGVFRGQFHPQRHPARRIGPNIYVPNRGVRIRRLQPESRGRDARDPPRRDAAQRVARGRVENPAREVRWQHVAGAGEPDRQLAVQVRDLVVSGLVRLLAGFRPVDVCLACGRDHVEAFLLRRGVPRPDARGPAQQGGHARELGQFRHR